MKFLSPNKGILSSNIVLIFLAISYFATALLAEEPVSRGAHIDEGTGQFHDGPIRMKEGYPSLEAAAQAALQDAWNRARAYGNGVTDTEFGGVIFYSKNGGFGYTTPATSERYLSDENLMEAATSVQPFKGIAKPGLYCSGCSPRLLTRESEEIVGVFHTHPDSKIDGIEIFSEYLSDADRSGAIEELLPNFMRYKDGIVIAMPDGAMRELPIQASMPEDEIKERDFVCSEAEPRCDDREGPPPELLAPTTSEAVKRGTIETKRDAPTTCLVKSCSDLCASLQVKIVDMCLISSWSIDIDFTTKIKNPPGSSVKITGERYFRIESDGMFEIIHDDFTTHVVSIMKIGNETKEFISEHTASGTETARVVNVCKGELCLCPNNSAGVLIEGWTSMPGIGKQKHQRMQNILDKTISSISYQCNDHSLTMKNRSSSEGLSGSFRRMQ